MVEKPKNKKSITRKLISVAFSVVSLGIISYIAITLISGRELRLPRLAGVFASRAPAEVVSEYHFNVGRNRVLVNLGDAVAAVGSLGVQVLDLGGSETLRDPYRMSYPAIETAGGRAIAFDVGGTSLRVFDREHVLTAFETNAAIVSASINPNGWFLVCSQEGGVFRGSVTVYNDRGSDVYRVDLASGYVLRAVLSPDNRRLAILSLTDFGGRIVFYNLDSETAGHSLELPGDLILDLRFLPGGDLIAVTSDSLIAIDSSGMDRELYGYFDKRLGAYSIGDSLIALHLLDYGVGHRGRLITIGENGRLLGELTTDREIVSLSAGDTYLAVLGSDGPTLYDSELDSIPQSDRSGSAAGAAGILTLAGGVSIVYGDHTAVVIEAES